MTKNERSIRVRPRSKHNYDECIDPLRSEHSRLRQPPGPIRHGTLRNKLAAQGHQPVTPTIRFQLKNRAHRFSNALFAYKGETM